MQRSHPPKRGASFKSNQNNKKRKLDPAAAELRRLAREVHAFGSSALSKWEKRKFDTAQLKAQGRLVEKPPRIPLKILQGMRKKEKQREQKRQQELREQGIYTKKPRRRIDDRNAFARRVLRGDRQGIESGARGLKATLGKFKDGVIYVPKSQLNVRKPGKK
jgi:hypothetical protein